MGLFKYLLLATAFFMASASYKNLERISAESSSHVFDEALYLPNGRGLDFLSFGYQNALSHFLWFKTISYFGKHYKSDRNYHWLDHMCSLVVELNPKQEHVYDFCGLMLSWEANLPEQSISILNKGATAYPHNWKFPYLRGMTYLIFLKDNVRASEDFKISAAMPEAHPLVKRIAERDLNIENNQINTVEFLEEMIKNSKNEAERSALINKLNEIRSAQ